MLSVNWGHLLGNQHVQLNDGALVDGWYMEPPQNPRFKIMLRTKTLSLPVQWYVHPQQRRLKLLYDGQ